MIDRNFKFRVNISNDWYEKKTDATACLSLKGAKYIGKEKMAFRECDVTVDQFLQCAMNGYTFCNLFTFDPNKFYWFETSNGRRYKSMPLYPKGKNQGCMRLEFKCDRFFHGAQTVFVDIDKTRFESIPEYLQCLTIPPTCVYMSYSDRQEKRGVTSRRFRMVYVFDHVLGKEDLNVVSRCITDSIVRDTGEPMEDDCGERVSQYFNGVHENDEWYASYRIYYRFEFPESLPPVDESQYQTQAQDPTKPTVQFSPQLIWDMTLMDYQKFMSHYSWRYKYYYRTESDYWINGTYQLTDDNYLQLWWPTEIITDGNNRRRKLFKRACLRRLMKPDVDADTLLFNMYVDFHRFIDNSDNVITLETLKRRTERAMQMDWDDLLEYCDYEIGYWRDHKHKFILHPDLPYKQSQIRSITKEVHYSEIDSWYDRSRSVKENSTALNVPLRTLYRYCSERGIDTNPGKPMTESQRREANRQAKTDMKARFMLLYDPNLSAPKNLEIMRQNGIDISEGTVRNWGKGYIAPNMPSDHPEPSDPALRNWNWSNDYSIPGTPSYPRESSDPVLRNWNDGKPVIGLPSTLSNYGWSNTGYDPNDYMAWNNKWASGQ